MDIDFSDGHSLIHTVAKENSARIPPRVVNYRSYKKCNVTEFEKDLRTVPFQICGIFDNPSDSYWTFQNLFVEVLDQHAPRKTKKVRANEPPFINATFGEATRRKSQLHKRFKKFPCDRNWNKYREQRNLTTKIRRNSI